MSEIRRISRWPADHSSLFCTPYNSSSALFPPVSRPSERVWSLQEQRRRMNGWCAPYAPGISGWTSRFFSEVCRRVSFSRLSTQTFFLMISRATVNLRVIMWQPGMFPMGSPTHSNTSTSFQVVSIRFSMEGNIRPYHAQTSLICANVPR